MKTHISTLYFVCILQGISIFLLGVTIYSLTNRVTNVEMEIKEIKISMEK